MICAHGEGDCVATGHVTALQGREVVPCTIIFKQMWWDARLTRSMTPNPGHTSLKMLWERYEKFIKNRARSDGSALMNMLNGRWTPVIA
jgi:hypothetical protein